MKRCSCDECCAVPCEECGSKASSLRGSHYLCGACARDWDCEEADYRCDQRKDRKLEREQEQEDKR